MQLKLLAFVSAIVRTLYFTDTVNGTSVSRSTPLFDALVR